MPNIKVETIRNVKVKIEEVFLKMGMPVKTIVTAEESLIRINVDSKDKALLIGHRGESLFALRHILAIICKKMLPEGTSFLFDVSDYLKEKERRIEKMAEQAIRNVIKTGKKEVLAPMSPYERLIVHQKVSVTKGVTSHSEGEREERKVIIEKSDE